MSRQRPRVALAGQFPGEKPMNDRSLHTPHVPAVPASHPWKREFAERIERARAAEDIAGVARGRTLPMSVQEAAPPRPTVQRNPHRRRVDLRLSPAMSEQLADLVDELDITATAVIGKALNELWKREVGR